MKIVILGGGLTGLTAAHYLVQKGEEVVVIEKGERWGGLAGGFKLPGWEWELERTYHHIFKNDDAILHLAKEINYQPFIFSRPITASLFREGNNYCIYPVDSPQDFLLLPTLSFISKMRAGITLVFLKLSPFLRWFELIPSAEFLQKTMGREVWKTLWEQLFRKKYGKYAEKIVTSFIWARIKKRTAELGYPEGGFQSFVDALAADDGKKGVQLFPATTIQSVRKIGSAFEIISINQSGEQSSMHADRIISTLPYPVSCIVMKEALGQSYIKEQSKRKYLFAVNLILKTHKPILEKVYWLNVGVEDIPIMCLVQHTNFVDKKRYDNSEICYVAWYVDEESELLKKNSDDMLAFILPHLKKIAPQLEEVPEVVALFKAPFAQPIFDREFTMLSRSFVTPDKNIFIANMDMTYPYDRGTNYAVQLGRDVSNLILKV